MLPPLRDVIVMDALAEHISRACSLVRESGLDEIFPAKFRTVPGRILPHPDRGPKSAAHSALGRLTLALSNKSAAFFGPSGLLAHSSQTHLRSCSTKANVRATNR